MTPIATAKTTTSNDEDRYRIKLGIHTELQDAHASMMHALYLTNLEDED